MPYYVDYYNLFVLTKYVFGLYITVYLGCTGTLLPMEIEVVNFTNLNENLTKQVLEWRNTATVRHFSNNHNEITIHEHKAFVDKLKIKKTSEYYFVNLHADVQGGGVIHFNDITENEATIGLYKNLKSTMHNVGEILMDLILIIAKQKKLKKIKLDVLKNNGRALVLYGRYNFRIIYEDENSYIMEKDLR
jgi:UDP-4-amino-4,6-dideoxy-N-acetyl-beta-L-altrosamine N-acetyltransferase